MSYEAQQAVAPTGNREATKPFKEEFAQLAKAKYKIPTLASKPLRRMPGGTSNLLDLC